MKFLFDDETFSFETLRTTGFALYGGADLGEVLTTASHIGEGDEPSWHQAWKATAQRVAEIGEQALASGHLVSAREALLRASNYYRTAGDFLLEHPATDPEMTLLSAGQHDTFVAAAALFDTPVQDVSIPYGDTTLPAYLFLVDDSGAARDTRHLDRSYHKKVIGPSFVETGMPCGSGVSCWSAYPLQARQACRHPGRRSREPCGSAPCPPSRRREPNPLCRRACASPLPCQRPC